MDLPSISEIKEFIILQMQTNQWFQTVGFFGLLGIVWQYTKKAPILLWERVKRQLTYRVIVYETDEFFEYIEEWLVDNHSKSYRNIELKMSRTFTEAPLYESDKNSLSDETHAVTNTSFKEQLTENQFDDFFYIRRRLNWIRIWKGREKLENANNLKSAYLNRFEIKGIFAKKAIKKIVEEVIVKRVDKINALKVTPVKVFYNQYEYWHKLNNFSPRHMDGIVLPADLKEDLLATIEQFNTSKDWYAERSILYKLGLLFEGPPGNGKTTLLNALARHTNRDLYMITNPNISNSELLNLFRNLPPNSILAMEDIDAIFDENRKRSDSNNSAFNLSTLLNCLDGSFSQENVITIFTTNHKERLDPALIRSGRMDHHFTIPNPVKSDIEKYLSIFYESNIILENYTKNLSMSDIQGICIENKLKPQTAIKELSN